MKKTFKKLSIVALILMLCGGIVFLVGFIGTGASFKKMGYIKNSEVKTVAETDEVSTVYIRGNSNDVTVVYSETAEKLCVEYTDLLTKKGDTVVKTVVSQTNGTLKITQKTEWLKTLLSFYSPDANVKLIVPKERVIALQVETDSGDIRVQGERAVFQSLNLDVDSGDILLTEADVVCSGTVSLETDTGDIKIGNLTAQNVRIEADTGDIRVSGTLEADDLMIEVDTGCVYAANGLLNTKKAVLEADTGDIHIKMAGKQSDYEIRAKTDTGDKNIGNQLGGERVLKIETDTGDIRVSFAE